MVIGKLIRKEYLDKQTLGEFTLYDSDKIVFKCHTLELPWIKNERKISCIPVGEYECVLVDKSPSFNYKHYDVKEVPRRSGVKIHAGNYYTQIKGCLLFGKTLTDLNKDGYRDVTSTRETLEELIKHAGNKFTLSIKNSKALTNESNSNNNLDSSPLIVSNPWISTISE